MIRRFVVVCKIGTLTLIHISDRTCIHFGASFKRISQRNKAAHVAFKVRHVPAVGRRYVVTNFAITPVAIEAYNPVGNLDFPIRVIPHAIALQVFTQSADKVLRFLFAQAALYHRRNRKQHAIRVHRILQRIHAERSKRFVLGAFHRRIQRDMVHQVLIHSRTRQQIQYIVHANGISRIGCRNPFF